MKKFFKKRWPWFLGVCILAAAIACLPASCNGKTDSAQSGEPVLIIETPHKLSASQTEPFVLDVTVSELSDWLYPAMSISISFDSSKLEFLGVEEGNLCVLSDENSAGKKLPDWSCNVQNSNDIGLINIMYLDMTGGKNAFTQTLMADSYNVVLRLKFRLRGSVQQGDVLDLIVEDAVFAASDESRSLAATTNTLKVKNSKIVIGE